jgi:cell division protein FtsI/penicillin-binding protein 2
MNNIFKRKQKPRSTRQAKKNSNNISGRLKLLLGLSFVLVVVLGVKAYQLQITDHEEFLAQISENAQKTSATQAQRGDIYDQSGKLLVSNSASQAIVYEKPANVTEKSLYKIANAVGDRISIDTSKLSDANYATYYINSTKRAAQVAKDSGTEAAPGTDAYVADLKKYVMKHKDEYKLSDSQINKAMIFQKMANAYSLSTVYLKDSDVTQDEIAAIGENQDTMPGVTVGLSYKRSYPEGDAVKNLVGTVGSIPDDEVNSLLKQGYSRDDQVGVSFIEKQYESVLKGTKKQKTVTTDSNGNETEKTTVAGQKGDSLVLTINTKFQEDVRNVIKNHMPGGQTQGGYAVIMNPKTGAIYAMVGVDRDTSTGTLTSNDSATINKSMIIGSAVKPALVATGMMNGVISPSNSTITDQPIQIAGSPVKASWFNKTGGANTALTGSTALEVSSNSYVMQVMLKMGGLNYYSGMDLSGLKSNIFEIMRSGFAEFGLGVKTGIDMPGEVAGIKGDTSGTNIGFALDESFGQYDTYTPMQMAQYASTVANGGYRVQPHVVDSIVSINNGQRKTVKTIEPTVLGKVNWSDSERQVIWDGMNLVVNGTSPYVTGNLLKSLSPGVYAKSGTGETVTNGYSTYNYSMISFLPSGNVAMGIVYPGTPTTLSSSPAISATKDLWTTFWADVEDSGSATNH